MKKIVICMLAALFGIVAQGYAQTEQERQLSRAERKAAQAAIDSLSFEVAKQAIKEQSFVLEADQVIFKRGLSAFVTSNTNFVAVDGKDAVVQVAFNVPAAGPNGIGGITVSGTVSRYTIKEEKSGSIYLTMSVQGTGISAQISIRLNKGSNDASVDILPNFHSNTLTLRGTLLPMEEANVYQGRTL